MKNKFKKIFFNLITISFLFIGLFGFNLNNNNKNIVNAGGSGIDYLDEKGVTQNVASYNVVSSSTTTWTSGWYVVNENVNISKTIMIENADVHLILCDGCTLTINVSSYYGFYGSTSGNLSIYSQSLGNNMGVLNVSSTDKNAIYANKIIINGGNVTATGSASREGILAESDVIVNNGNLTVKTTCDTRAGLYVNNSNYIQNGGTVVAEGIKYGIYANTKLLIAKGTLTATASSKEALSCNSIKILGATVLKAGSSSSNATSVSNYNNEKYVYAECNYSGTLTYDKNAGTDTVSDLPTDNKSYGYDDLITVSSTTPSRTGYTFNGWNTKADGTGTTYQASSTFSMPDANVTLYAKWTPTDYTITYNLDGGTNDSNNPVKYTIESDTITLANPTKTGYKFFGWYGESTFSTQVTTIAKGSTSDKTLYAKWAKIYEYNNIQFDIPLDSTFTGGTLSTGNYYFSDNITLTSKIYISANATVNILFNGHYLNCNSVKTPIESVGSLGLYDKYKGVKENSYLHTFDIDNKGLAVLNEQSQSENKISVYGGLITGIKSENSFEYGIYCYEEAGSTCGSITVKGLTFIGNYSTYENVGIYIKESTGINLDNIDFLYNYIDDKTGASNNSFICVYSGYGEHPFVCDNITFKYNIIRRDDTSKDIQYEEVGLFIDIETNNMKCSGKAKGIAVLNNITIEENDIEDHDLKGLIYSRYATLEINTGLFKKNKITSKQKNDTDECSIDGGFIYTSQSLTLTNVDIINNTISSEYIINGGLICINSYIIEKGNLTLDNCKINNNTIFRENKIGDEQWLFGGIIYSSTNPNSTNLKISINNTTIDSNKVDIEGVSIGALIYSDESDVEIISSSITNNSIDSDTYNGGIVYTNKKLTVEGTSTNYINITGNKYNKDKETVLIGEYSGLIFKSAYNATLRYININNNYVNYNLKNFTNYGILMYFGFYNSSTDNTLIIEHVNINNNTVTSEESGNANVAGYFINSNLTSTLTNVGFDGNTIVTCDCYAGGLFANENFETKFENVDVNNLTVTMLNKAIKTIGSCGSIAYTKDLKIDDESAFTNNSISSTTKYLGGLIHSSGVLSCHATIDNNTISSTCTSYGTSSKGLIIYANDITSLEGSISENTITSYLLTLGGLVYNEGTQNKEIIIKSLTCDENEITIDFIGNSDNVIGGLFYLKTGSASIYGNSSFDKNTIKITTDALSFIAPFIYSSVTLSVGDTTFDYNDIDIIMDHENQNYISNTYGLIRCTNLYISQNTSFNNNDIYLERTNLEGGICKADNLVNISPSVNKITFNDNNIHASNSYVSAISGGIIYTNNLFMNDSQDQTNDIEFINNIIKANKSNINGGIIRTSCNENSNFSYAHDITFDSNTIKTNDGNINGGIIFNQTGNKRIIIKKITITNNIFKDDHTRTSNDTETSGFYGTIKSDSDIEIYNILIELNEYDNFFTADGFALNISNAILTIDTFEFNNNIVDVNKASALFIKINDETNTSVSASLKDVTVLDNEFTTHDSMGTVNQNDYDCTSFINFYSNKTSDIFGINNLDVEGNTININSKFGGFMYIYSSITIDGYKLKDNTVHSLSTSGLIFNDYSELGSCNAIKNVVVQGNAFTCKGLSYNTMFNACTYINLINFEVIENLFTFELSRGNKIHYNNNPFSEGTVKKYYLFNIDTQSSLTNFKFNNNISTVTIFKGENDGEPELWNSVESVFKFTKKTLFDNVEFKSNTFNLYSLNNGFINFGQVDYLYEDVTIQLKDLNISNNTINTAFEEDTLSPIVYISSPYSNNELKTVAELSGLIIVKLNTIDNKTVGLSTSIGDETYSCLKFNSLKTLNDESYIDLMFNEFTDDYSKQLLFINGKDYIDIFNVLNDRFYLLIDESDIYYSGRVEFNPTQSIRKFIVHLDDLLTNGYQASYKWYRGTTEVLNQNTFEFTSLNYVFGSFNCVLTLTKQGLDPIVFTSKIFALSPTIINNPTENNNYLFDVDLSKNEAAGVTVSYEWYMQDESSGAGAEVFDNDLVTTYSTPTNLYFSMFGNPTSESICSSYDSEKGCYINTNNQSCFGISFVLSKGDFVTWNVKADNYQVYYFSGEGTSTSPASLHISSYIYAIEDGTYWILCDGTDIELYLYKYELSFDDAEVGTYEDGEIFAIGDDDSLVSSIYDETKSMYYINDEVENSYFGVELELKKNDVILYASEMIDISYFIVQLMRIDEGYEGIYYGIMSYGCDSVLIPIPADGKYLLVSTYVSTDGYANPGIIVGISHQEELDIILSSETESDLPITGVVNENGILEPASEESYVGFDIYLDENEVIYLYYYDDEFEGIIKVLYNENDFEHDEENLILKHVGCSLIYIAPKAGYYTFYALDGDESFFGGQHLFAIKLGSESYTKIDNVKQSLSNTPSGKYYAKAIYHQGDETFTLKSKAFEYTKQNRIFDINSNNDNEEEKPIIKCSSNTGFSEDVIVTVEVTLEAEVKEAELTIDYYNVNSGLAKLNSNEKIGVVYDVKLLRNGVVIQPSDLGENTVIKVRMLIPDTVDINKVTRLIHVHNKNEIHSYAFDKTKVDSEGYYEIDLMKFSEFAFVYEVETPTNKKSELIQIILVILLIILSLVLINTILYVTWKYSVLKTKDDTIFDRYFRFMDKGYVKFCKLFTKKERLFTRLNTLEEQRLTI